MNNRSIAAACLALAASGTSVAAQTAPAPRGPTRIGVLAGVNIATIHGSDDEGVSSHVGFVGGAYVSLGLTPVLSLRPELLYSQKGAETRLSEEGVTAEAKVKLAYVELPVLLVADLPVSGNIKPQLYAGPSFAFRASCTVEASAEGFSFSGSCDDTADGASNVKSFDLGAMVGGALKFDLKNGGAFAVGARYTLGLTDIGEGADAKNRALGIVASYEFALR
ncbi:porin family protein [Gemmatirosa kalamazoonensis]|nr:porin family protein [Gemmatirosa kalamazoonensis]